jgi:hypothetical protein
LICSQDLFDKGTVNLLSQRFKYFIKQIFVISSQSSLVNNCLTTSIGKLSVILPEEAGEIEAVIYRRLESIVEQGT